MGAISNFLSKIFGGRKEKSFSNGSLVNWMGLWMSSDAKAEMDATFNACVDTNSEFLCAIQPKCVIGDHDADGKKHLTELMSLKPNRANDAPTFYESMAHSYFSDNIAIAWIIRDLLSPTLEPIEIWQLDVNDSNFQIGVSKSDGKIYASFNLSGSTHYASYDDLVIVQRNKSVSDLLSHRSKCLDQSLKVIAATSTGAERAVTESQYIRFLAQTNSQFSDSNQDAMTSKLQDVLSKAKNGVGVVPAGATLTPINISGKWLPDADASGFKKDIYNYLGTNEKMTNRSFNEDEYQSFFNGTELPFIRKLEAQLTLKMLTENERIKGNKIIIPKSPHQCVSMKTRIQMVSAMSSLPTIRPNDALRLLDLPTYEDGENPQASLNFVKSQDQSQYQTGKTPKEEK